MKNKADALVKFDELAERLEPEIFFEASIGDIDWKPFRKFISKVWQAAKQSGREEIVEHLEGKYTRYNGPYCITELDEIDWKDLKAKYNLSERTEEVSMNE